MVPSYSAVALLAPGETPPDPIAAFWVPVDAIYILEAGYALPEDQVEPLYSSVQDLAVELGAAFPAAIHPADVVPPEPPLDLAVIILEATLKVPAANE